MEDKKIVDLYWERSENAILETAKKYGKLCYSIAYNILRNSEDSEECVNDTYLGAWNSMPTQRPDKLTSFLCKITRCIAINKYEYNIALCINGQKISSIKFAQYVDKLFIINSNITFIIGGSNGLDKSILDCCDDFISFSDMTFPHGLFRGILLEQIYRTFKINNNESYHK